MDFTSPILGKGTAETLQARATKPLLQIGKDSFTRGDLAAAECFSFVAAENLNYWLNKKLKVDDTRDLFENVAPHELAIPRVGVFSLAVLAAAFEAKRIGGDHPLEAWLKKHKMEVCTFHTMKVRELTDQRAENREKKERKRKRKNQAHELRVERFTKRSEAAEGNGK